MTARARSPKVLEGEIVEGSAETVEEDREPRLHKLGGVEILMERPSDAQMTILIRLAKAAERDMEGAFARLADVFFRIVEALIVDESDIDVLVEEIVQKRVTMKTITDSLISGAEDAKPANRRTRRAR